MEFFNNITPGVTLLTPNRRLAAWYLKQYQFHQQAEGKTIWNSLDILPFHSWLERTWQIYSCKHIAEQSFLLNSNQELILWEKILSKSSESEHLLQIFPTAELIKSAWGILKQWNVELNHLSGLTDDSYTFVKWATQFQNQCIKNNWIDQNSLCTQITEKVQQHEISIPHHIIMIGFTEISPQHKKLLSAYEQAGSKISYYSQENKNNSMYRVSLCDKETEIRTMARWAKNLEGKGIIACIVPNLEDHREMISRIFSEVFTEKGYYTSNPLILPFNISAGKNLGSYPIIQTALALLDLDIQALSIETLNLIFHSPFLGEAEKEMLQRAEFFIQLHRDNISKISLNRLINKKHIPEYLAIRFKNYLHTVCQIKNKCRVSEWVNIFIELLTLLGWPGERSINSEEYQLIQRWMGLLHEYLAFDATLNPIDYTTALQYLKRLTSQTVFQPQSPETSIQILGILEAAEIPFDYAWIMGMDDATWPPSPKPNPFIPIHLQKKLSMPHASAERELNFCMTLTRQLKNSANTVIFSHPLFDAESEVRGSPLLKDISEISVDELVLSPHTQASHYIFEHQQLEFYQDDFASQILEIDKITGGAKIFELQAACPFKAFSELRLFAKPIDPVKPGLRPYDRGNIVHKALELIWSELKDSTTLQLKSTDELQTMIDHAISQAIYQITGDENHQLNYLKLEQQRLNKILWKWIEIEKVRPAFSVVSQEQSQQLTISHIPITLRIDRIDELSNGHRFIIDYKTGKNNQIAHWFGERPEALQLPLYCLLDPLNTIGIAFATLHSEKIELKGISKYPMEIASVEPFHTLKQSDTQTWEEQILYWHKTLEKLGEDFRNGKAPVDPKEGFQTCEHCQLKSLCRIHERSLLEQ